MATLADVEAVLAALDPDLEPAARAIVSDDGAMIWLTLYTATGVSCRCALERVKCWGIECGGFVITSPHHCGASAGRA